MRNTTPTKSELYIKEHLPHILAPLANAVLLAKPKNPVRPHPHLTIIGIVHDKLPRTGFIHKTIN